MSDIKLDSLWLSQLFESEEILTFAESYSDKINIEISSIIFSDVPIIGADLVFLDKILQACGISSDKYLILNSLVSYKHIKTFYPEVKSIFLFNVNVQQLEVNFRLGQMDTCKIDDRYFIACPALSQMANNNELKAYFWNTLLKPIFANK